MQVGENKKESPNTLTTLRADITFIPRQRYPSQTHTDRQGTRRLVSNHLIKVPQKPYLSDILVPDSADLLDVGSTLGNGLQGVAGELELILDVGRGENLDTGLADNMADVLLTQEVTDTN